MKFSSELENQVIIKRKWQIAGSAVKHTVYLDGKNVGKLKSGGTLVVNTFPGHHSILVSGILRQEATLSFFVPAEQRSTVVFDQLDLMKSNIKLSIREYATDEAEEELSPIALDGFDKNVEKDPITISKEKIDTSKYWIKGDIDLLETDLVITSHAEICCERCARYRNRIYSLTGADRRFPKIPEDFDSSCCSISLYPFVWGVSEPGLLCDDPIKYSNRPFSDDRTDDEKERYENWRRKTKPGISFDVVKTPMLHPVRVEDHNQTEMDIIRRMEARFEEQYKFAYNHLLNFQDCQKMYAQTVREFEGIELPLMVQVRFEQLCAEYEEKFNDTNPFVIIDAMDGYSFEKWCAELLRKNGYTNVEVTPGSGDQGVDVIAVKDGIRYAIQCKCYSSDLGNTPVQEVRSGKDFYDCDVAVVMTNRYFTKGAKQLAEKTMVRLWGRDKLKEMIELSANRDNFS